MKKLQEDGAARPERRAVAEETLLPHQHSQPREDKPASGIVNHVNLQV
jgi:hypothetical protein